MKYHAEAGGQHYEAEKTGAGVRLNGVDHEVDAVWFSDDEVRIAVDGRSYRVFVRPLEAGWQLNVLGRNFDVSIEEARARSVRQRAGSRAGEGGQHEVRAPMPGLVVRVLAKEGQRVGAGDGLVVIEAMKMENEIRASGSGTVAAIKVGPGDVVERDEILIALRPGTSGAEEAR